MLRRSVLAVAATAALILPAAASAAPAPISATATQTSTKQTGTIQRLTETLRVGGKVIGTNRITCTATSQTVARCAATFTFAKGTVKVAGTVHFDRPVSQLAVTGGTGSYSGADGTLKVHFVSDTKSMETFSFR